MTVMLRLCTSRSIACTLCVRLVQARFASSRSCARRMSSSKLVASLSCLLPICRVSRITFASPPASTSASGYSFLSWSRALEHAYPYLTHAVVDLLLECTGPYHAPTISDVLGRCTIQKPDRLGAAGMFSLVFDSRKLRWIAAPVPLPGERVGSGLYSSV